MGSISKGPLPFGRGPSGHAFVSVMDADLAFTLVHAPGAEGDERGLCNPCRRLLFLGSDEEIHLEEAGGHRRPDGGRVGAVTLADGTSSDLDDSVLPTPVFLPQVVQAEAHELVCRRPTTLADLVADEHVEQAPRLEVESEHRSEIDLLDHLHVAYERPPDRGSLC